MRNIEESVGMRGTCPKIASVLRPSNEGGGQSLLCRAWNDQRGQVLPWVVVLMGLFLGMSALVIDIGHAMVVQHQLQESADAAALAAAETMPSSTYTTVGQTYSAGTSDKNIFKGLSISSGTATITPKCLTTVSNWGAACSSTTPNAVSVTQTATFPTFFAGIFGVKSVTVSATSTASGKGAVPLPYNVAIILDSTLSMVTYDSNCGATQMNCALQGVQQLLQNLSPSADHVALFTFPNVTTGTVSRDSNCATSINSSSFPYYQPLSSYISMLPNGSWASYSGDSTGWSGMANAVPYSFPAIPTNTSGYTVASGTGAPTYQVVGFSTNYRTSNTATSLNSSSALVKAAGGVSGCGGMLPSNFDGDYGTYYAGALYAAQAALLAEQANNPGSKNVMIILGDGNSTAPASNGSPDSNSPGMPSTSAQATQSLTSNSYTLPSSYLLATSNGSYPSWNGECGQAVDAATYAQNYSGSSTLIYTIAYGASTSSNSSNCASDVNAGNHQGISPCQTLQQMSTGWSSGTQTNFYSDYYAPGGDSGCQAADKNNQVTSLNSIFTAIWIDLTSVRLIPNNTY
jgi:Flp pilus assembly protein TadG